jgi:hypothetical protein
MAFSKQTAFIINSVPHKQQGTFDNSNGISKQSKATFIIMNSFKISIIKTQQTKHNKWKFWRRARLQQQHDGISSKFIIMKINSSINTQQHSWHFKH